MPTLAEDTQLTAAEGVILGELPDETVLLSVATGTAVRLNGTSAWLWSRLGEVSTLGELADALADRYGIDRERALGDVRSFAEDLASRSLLDLR